ncbi:MAG: polyphosphate kinase 1 [Anaerolineaceae bacterium]|nr:polyphosphate kinase 1 [Anaerolineaceae bacterium]
MVAQAEDTPLPELNPQTYFNRELSWIEFNRRVLAMAQDESVPLLERVKFLAIFSNNLDEFYMVRVASVHDKLKVLVPSARPDGYQPGPLLAEIRNHVVDLVAQQRVTMREVFTKMAEEGIRVLDITQLDPTQRGMIREYFHSEIFPVLTPLAVDHVHPFPFISNLSLNLAVWLKRSNGHGNQDTEFVRIKVPEALPRLVDVGKVLRRYSNDTSMKDSFLWMEDVISDNLDSLFPGMRVLEQYPFRVTRDADVDYEQEEDIGSMSALIEESLKERRFGSVVRLSVPDNISDRTREQLIKQLGVDPERDVYLIDGALGASSLFELSSVDRNELKYPPFLPRVPDNLGEHDIFSAIRKGDILLHHPYDSFLPVEAFFRAAARDPDTLAIKATLYRVGKNSPIVEALLEARDLDKQVAVLVELKARFDEENNLEWARQLEHKGVHVTYGVEELPVKTHAKVALVVRREADGVRRYIHLGTGNYNAGTARLYTDIGLLTCNNEIADDVSKLFNRLTGYAPATTYNRLLVAPEHLHAGMIALIDNEIAAAQAGKEARLIFKMNQLEEDIVIQKLYQASQAGVQIDLIVRGLSCLVPNIPGVSENIRLRSHIGRFLEHSRIFYFQNAPPAKRLYLGSADMMRRNLYNRVEVVFPVLEARLQKGVMRILATYLQDNELSWAMQSDGSYVRMQPLPDAAPFNAQVAFMEDSFGVQSMP